MKKIEDVLCDKIFSLLNYCLAKKIKPDLNLKDIKDLTETEIDKLKQLGIDGIILDVDNTIRRNMQQIPNCNKEWIEVLKSKMKVIVVSNGKDEKIEEYFRQNQIEYIGFARKPLKTNFLKACEKIQLDPKRVLVIGDSVISDIYGGKRNNMKTALVKKVKYDDNER